MADDLIPDDMPDPDLVALEAARAIVDGLPERAASDVTAAFKNEVLEACVVLRKQALVEFIALEAKMRPVANFPKGEWRSAISNTAKVAAVRPGPATPSVKWHSLLTYTNGKPDATEANVVSALVHAPEWKGVLAFNEFANNVVARKPPPWHRDDMALGGSRAGEWADGDDTRLQCWLQRAAGMRVPVATSLSAMAVVAQRTPFHPVREYLESLAWDGVVRLPSWLSKYAGACEQPSAYLERVGTWFLISAVARIYEPGCKADHCVILEGTQGRGKSTLVRLLVPRGEWFAEHNANLMDKDSYAILQGRWIMELAEMDSLARAEVGRIKRYMTTAIDAYRPVWARRVARFPRHCVFIGTVNDSEYLRDPTGNRRFWPVKVSDIDTAALTRDRDQLWAEAVHYFKEGVHWWPGRDDESLLESEQEERLRVDVWEEPIAAWLVARVKEFHQLPQLARCLDDIVVRVDQILSGAIGKQKGDQEDRDAIRVGRIMTRLGWERRRVRSANDDRADRDTAGKHRRVYAYYPPETQVSAVDLPGTRGDTNDE
jgi:putative DNA primase/helicase